MRSVGWCRRLALCGALALVAATGCDGGEVSPPDASGADGSVDSGAACDGCLIGEACIPAGTADPSNPCMVCDPEASATELSPDDGASCDDGLSCTERDTCSAGACSGETIACDDGISCNGAEMCSEDAGGCEPGASACGAGELCDAATDACVVGCTGGCTIDGTCYGARQANPLEPCLVCDPSASATDWSSNEGATCEDGEFCTTGDVCAAGVCVGGAARDCDDGVACDGAETCDELADVCQPGASTCASDEICDVASDTCVTSCTGCVIGGTCFGAGQRNPANQCEVCDPAASAAGWSSNDGASCDDGLFCTDGDVCAGTTCGGAARVCSDGISCNGAETCDEVTDACTAGAATCGGGTLCDPATDACVTTCSGCVIDGSCYGAGQANPLNACEVCDVGRSTSSWSANDGARCDDGLFCTDGDVCAAGVCGGAARSCSDGVACNGTETCDEGAGACAAGATTCAATELCDTAADACVTTCAGCVVGGVCYAQDTRNPANACEICDTARSRTAFSANDGASCDDGFFCTTGDTCSGGMCAGSAATFCDDGLSCNGAETCNESTDRCVAGATTCGAGQVCDPGTDACVTACTGCVIGGVCHAAGARNPANECQVCDTASSATDWTANTGARCDDGLYCTVADVCSASAVCGGAARGCGDGVTCNGAETCNESADRCDAGASTCGAGQVCDTAADVCVTTCSGCVIGGVCYAPSTTNPANGCQVCDPSASTSAWSANTGAACDDGLFCTVGEACSAAAVCAGGTARSCDDGVSCNGSESCNESTDRCDAGTSTCGAGQVCDAAADSCVLSCGGGTSLCGGSCVNTSYDPGNCGSCGNVCPDVANSEPVCVSGSCSAVCDSGFGDCDLDPTNGCQDLQSDNANCGACGNVCAGGETCMAGVCQAFTPVPNEILYNGYYYATLDGAPPGADYGTWTNTCQTNPIALPTGWALVPEDAGVVANVIRPNVYGTHCILFSNGVSYGVRTYNNGNPCGCSGSVCMSESPAGTWRVTSCSRRILIRRPAP